jgi:hypothetical protein
VTCRFPVEPQQTTIRFKKQLHRKPRVIGFGSAVLMRTANASTNSPPFPGYFPAQWFRNCLIRKKKYLIEIFRG